MSISFVPTTYTTDEGEDAVLMIALNRVADRPISVDVSTSENTATGRVAIRSDNIITHSHIF